MGPEPPAKDCFFSQKKKEEDAVDMRQNDHRLQGTSKMFTGTAMVPTILMTGLGSASHKNKKSESTLIGATVKRKMLSQCVESTDRLQTFNHESRKRKRRRTVNSG